MAITNRAKGIASINGEPYNKEHFPKVGSKEKAEFFKQIPLMGMNRHSWKTSSSPNYCNHWSTWPMLAWNQIPEEISFQDHWGNIRISLIKHLLSLGPY